MPLYESFRNLFSALFQGTTSPSVTGTTEQSIMPLGMGSKVIAANRLRGGTAVRVIAWGVMNSPLVGGTMTVKVKLNGVTIAQGVSASLLGSLTKAGWSLRQTLTVRTAGVSGTAVVAGDFSYPTGVLTNKSRTDLYSDPATPFAIDTTIDQIVDVTIQFSLGSHTVQTSTCTIEILDQ